MTGLLTTTDAEMSTEAQSVTVPPFTAEEAERHTRRISTRLVTIADNYEAVMPMIREAIERDAHKALGYNGISDYISERFGQTLQRLDVKVRHEVIRELGNAGMSTRAIAPVVGVSHVQVHRDLKSGVTDVTTDPLRVVGTDGKSYARTPPRGRLVETVPGVRRKRVDSNRIIEGTVSPMRLARPDAMEHLLHLEDLDIDLIPEWVDSITAGIAYFRKLRKSLLEEQERRSELGMAQPKDD